MGWAVHVRMHKRAFERVHGRLPENWQEVLEWYGVPAALEKPVPVKERVQTSGATSLRISVDVTDSALEVAEHHGAGA